MPEQPTCGQGLAEHAVLPAALANLTAALADNLEVHMHALDLSDPAARAEHDVWADLVARQRRITAQLRDTGAEMGGHADLPMGRHDPEALAAPLTRDALERLIAAERDLVEVLRERIARHEALLGG
jgi:hypothetical protein